MSHEIGRSSGTRPYRRRARTWRRRIARIFIAALGSLTLTASALERAHATVLPTCAIQLSDLRAGYIAASSGYVTQDLAAMQYHAPLAPYDARSALVSYLSSFYLPYATAYREVEGSLSLYASARRAETAYRTDAAQIQHWHQAWTFSDHTGQHRVDERWQAVAAPPIGNESHGWMLQTQDGRNAYSIALFFFRQGPYLGSVRIFGPLHTVTLLQNIPLARLIDRRVQSTCALR